VIPHLPAGGRLSIFARECFREEEALLAPLWILSLILSLAPAAVLLWYIRSMDRYEPEPWPTVFRTFLVGCLSVIPALLIEQRLAHGDTSSFVGTVYMSFVVAAMTEELCKGALTFAYIWRRPEFNEVMDGIVYFGVGHMGFAVTENLMYVFTRGEATQSILTAFVRATTAVPLHVIVGMIMGYHLGMVRFTRHWWVKGKHLLAALSLPIGLHGVYDLAAFNKDVEIERVADLLRAGFGTALMYAAVAALWAFLIPRVQKAQEASPWRPISETTLPAAPVPCPYCGSPYPLEANYCHMCAAPVGSPYSKAEGR
jgi:RsiW-degrading membrane proteinase PrsW (M82 family)